MGTGIHLLFCYPRATQPATPTCLSNSVRQRCLSLTFTSATWSPKQEDASKSGTIAFLDLGCAYRRAATSHLYWSIGTEADRVERPWAGIPFFRWQRHGVSHSLPWAISLAVM